MEPATHLIICVNYDSESETLDLLDTLAPDDHPAIDLIVADNSPQTSDAIEARAAGSLSIEHMRFPTNPGYFGAGRLALSRLIARSCPLSYRTVTICNVDLTFSLSNFVQVIDRMTQDDQTGCWIIAPNIVEAGREFKANPHVLHRPDAPRRSLGHLLRRSYPTFAAYRWLYYQKRKRWPNRPAVGSIPRQIYAPHGSMLIFGSGYFRAGGVIHECPLFEEEHAVAEMAHAIDCPIIYRPDLTVHHEGEVSTAAPSRQRFEMYRTADRFYLGWRPDYALGGMSTWFV